jgi:exopolysaccharide biosynthesis protein
MTIEELAKLMVELGCVEAMNLDGGGSTTMVIRNKVINSPSDATGERPVSDALLVFTRLRE